MKNPLLTIALCGLFVSYGFAQTSVLPLKAELASSEGLVYKLPLTTLVIKAEATQTVQKPGPFFKYAERFLGTTNVVTEEKTEWHLDNVKVSSRSDADESKCYHVNINKKTTAYNLSLNDQGVIEAVNQSVVSRAETSKACLDVVVSDTTIKFDLSQLGEEALVASSIPKMAEMAAKQIYHIRESRANLLSGENEHLPDGTALQLMLKYLDKSEQELVALFVGKTITNKQVTQFYVTPKDDMQNHIVFRMSLLSGIVDAGNLLGRPVYLNVKAYKIANSFLSDSKKAKGLYYNEPGSAEVSVIDNSKELVRTTCIMPQFGIVKSLPAQLFDEVATQVVFTSLGTIQSISK